MRTSTVAAIVGVAWLIAALTQACCGQEAKPSTVGFYGGGLDMVRRDFTHDGRTYSWCWKRCGEIHFTSWRGDTGQGVPLAAAGPLWQHVEWDLGRSLGYPLNWYSEPALDDDMAYRTKHPKWGTKWTPIKPVGEVYVATGEPPIRPYSAGPPLPKRWAESGQKIEGLQREATDVKRQRIQYYERKLRELRQ